MHCHGSSLDVFGRVREQIIAHSGLSDGADVKQRPNNALRWLMLTPLTIPTIRQGGFVRTLSPSATFRRGAPWPSFAC
jgi:hypothetical protein